MTLRMFQKTSCKFRSLGETLFLVFCNSIIPFSLASIFLAMHIPIYAFIDQYAPKHAVDNIIELYEALGCTSSPSSTAAEVSRQSSSLPENIFLADNCSRKIISLHAHTHTNDNMLPGESFEGFNTALGARAGGPV